MPWAGKDVEAIGSGTGTLGLPCLAKQVVTIGFTGQVSCCGPNQTSAGWKTDENA